MDRKYHIEKSVLPDGTEVASVVYDNPSVEDDIMIQPMEKKIKKTK